MARSFPIDAEFPPEPMIPGVYNYCDRWCERCVFFGRCRVFRDARLIEQALERGQDPVQVLSNLAAAEIAEAERERSPSERAEWDDLMARANAMLAELEVDDAEARLKRRDAWIALVSESMVGRLGEIDTELARLFPGAAAFVRPGFDDGGASVWE